MMKDDYEIKDKILNYLNENSLEVYDTSQIEKYLNIEHNECNILLMKIVKEGYIGSGNPGGDNMSVKIKNDGIIFLRDGGYKAVYNANKSDKGKKKTEKIIGYVFNGLTILIAVWQIWLTTRTNELETKNTTLQNKVDSLVNLKPRQGAIIDTTKK